MAIVSSILYLFIRLQNYQHMLDDVLMPFINEYNNKKIFNKIMLLHIGVQVQGID